MDTGYNQEQVALLKKTICPGLTDDELKLFLHNCKKTGLDPLGRQIYAIKRGGRLTIQTGIDGLRLIAERTGKYAPGKPTEYLKDDNGVLLGAVAYVKKMTPDGTWHEVSATALVQEYNPGNNPMWKKMPSVMIAKVAESAALRRAFPAELSGVYSKEEMEQAGTSELYIKVLELLDGREDLEERMLAYCKATSIDQVEEHLLEFCYHKLQKILQKENEQKDAACLVGQQEVED